MGKENLKDKMKKGLPLSEMSEILGISIEEIKNVYKEDSDSNPGT